MNTELKIKGVVYSLSLRPTTEHKRGEMYRFEMCKVGDIKPYILTFNPRLYTDSLHEHWSCGCTGWTIKRGAKRHCKHIEAVTQYVSDNDVLKTA